MVFRADDCGKQVETDRRVLLKSNYEVACVSLSMYIHMHTLYKCNISGQIT